MMDVSDGLAIDLSRLARASGVGSGSSLDDVPVAAGATLDDALGGGEDYELLATLAGRRGVEAARRELKEAFGVPLTEIGRDRRGRRVSPRSTPTAPSARWSRPVGTTSDDASRHGAEASGPHDRRLRLGRWRRDPGRPQDVQRARRVRHDGHHRDHRAEHEGRLRLRGDGAAARGRADPRGDDRHRGRRGEDRACWRTAGIVRAVASVVAELAIPHLVVDPVFVSKHGHLLLADDAVDELRSRILPLATLVTPNLPEASGLAGRRRRGEGRHAPGRRRDPGARRRRGPGEGRPPRGLDRGRRPVRVRRCRGVARRRSGSTRRTRTGPVARCRRRSRRTWRWGGSCWTRYAPGRRS